MVHQLAFHIILMLCSIHTLAYAHVQDRIIAQPGCNSTCGDVEIPFPFGMNHPNCSADKWFEIECRSSTSAYHDKNKPYPKLKSIDVEVLSIDVSSGGTIRILHPIHHQNCDVVAKDIGEQQKVVDLRGSPFVYSQQSNKFAAVGCNNIAFLMSNGTQAGGCVSICDDDNDENLETDSCSGKYCCETYLPSFLSEFNVTIKSLGEKNVESSGHQCSYAVIFDLDSYVPRSSLYGYGYGYYPIGPRAHPYNVDRRPDGDRIREFKRMSNAIVVLEWEILRNSTVRLPHKSHCQNTNITSSKSTYSGRRCYCDEGFDGNPYIDGGCYATDYDPGSQPTDSSSHTKIIRAAKWAIVGVSSSLGSIIFLLGSRRLYKVVRKEIVKRRKEKYFKQNGGLLLEQKLSSGEVNVEKVKHFSLKDLKKATDHFNLNRVLGKGGQGTVYKGMLVDGKIVAVKKFRVQGNVEEFINEFVILSQINHRNVVKLLGCCLESVIPLLVYEFIPNGNLFEYLHDQNVDLPTTWDMRLRIAAEVAGALFYLHSAASQPIYHRDVKSTNILLDGKYRAKVADFGSSRMISIEDTHLTTVVQGTFGYLDPEYFHTCQFTEKSDVYSFGVVLVELLTGQKPISYLRPQEAKSLASYFVLCVEENRLFDIIDERVTKEGEKEHITAVANLAYTCLELNGRKRPTMKEIATELDGIRKLERQSNAQQNHEEIDVATVATMEDFQPWTADSASDPEASVINRTPSSEVIPILIK